MYFQADKAADATWMVYLFIGFVLTAAVIAVLAGQERRIWALSLTSLLFLVVSSLISEKFFPIPQGHWLAYNYRFVSTTPVVCLAIAGVVILRSTQGRSSRSLRSIASCAAVVTVVVSAVHLNSVRKAYERFNPPGDGLYTKTTGIRPPDRYCPAVERLVSKCHFSEAIHLSYNAGLQSGRDYYFRNLGGDVYPVRMRSARRVWPEGIENRHQRL